MIPSTGAGAANPTLSDQTSPRSAQTSRAVAHLSAERLARKRAIDRQSQRLQRRVFGGFSPSLSSLSPFLLILSLPFSSLLPPALH